MNEKNGLAPGFGKRIKDKRKELNMTQRELAKKSGVAFRSIQDYESEKRTPKIDTRIALANALSVSYSDLFVPDQAAMSFDSPEDFKKAWEESTKKARETPGYTEVKTSYGSDGSVTNEVITHHLDTTDLSAVEREELQNYKEYLIYKRLKNS